MSAGPTKECPFCAETIKAAARGCRFCGTVFSLEEEGGARAPATPAIVARPPMIAEAEVPDLLASLVEKSLVLYEEDEKGRGRYRLLETVRQYGRDRLLESKEGENLRARHGQFFLRLAEETEPRLCGPEQREWLARLMTEYDNCRAALEWSLGSDAGAELGLRLAAALTTFWARSRWRFSREAREWLEKVLASGSGEPSAARVKALISAGQMTSQYDSRAARSFFEAGLAGAEATGDRWDLLMAHGNLVEALVWRGEIEKARPHVAECQTLSQEIGTDGAMGYVQYLVGLIWLHELDFATAADCFEKSLSACREVGDRWFLAFLYYFLATTAYYLGDRSTMSARLNEAQSVFEELGFRTGLALVLLRRGTDAEDHGDHRAATALYEESLQLFRELDARHYQAHALHNRGRLARLAHEFDTARAYLRESLVSFAAADKRSGASRALSGLASLALADGEPLRAARLFGAAAALPDTGELPLSRAARADYDRCLAETRAELGEAAFAAAWSEGQALPLDQALALGLQDSRDASRSSDRMGREEHP